jgi:hypothetical protein
MKIKSFLFTLILSTGLHAQPGDYPLEFILFDNQKFVDCANSEFELFSAQARINWINNKPKIDLNSVKINGQLECKDASNWTYEPPFKKYYSYYSCLNTGILIIVRNKVDTMFIENVGTYRLSNQIPAIEYPSGSSAHTPFVLNFKKGIYSLTDIEKDPRRVAFQKQYYSDYIHRTEYLFPKVKVAAPKLNENPYVDFYNRALAGREGNNISVVNSSKKPITDAKVVVYYANDSSCEFKCDLNFKEYGIFRIYNGVKAFQRMENIKKISVSANEYLTEDLTIGTNPGITEVQLIHKMEGYIDRGSGKLAMHIDNRYLSIYVPIGIKEDTVGFKEKLTSLGLEIDTIFGFCGKWSFNNRTNSILLRKVNKTPFDDYECAELAILRVRFKSINVAPKLFMKVAGDGGNEKRFYWPITNKLKIMLLNYRQKQELEDLLTHLNLSFVSNVNPSDGFDITVSESWGIRRMNELIDHIKSKVQIYVEHQAFEKVEACLD